MPQHNLSLQMSGIRDNHHRGTVGDFLKDKIKDGSKLSIVSAYFTIYAFEALKEELAKIERLEFFFASRDSSELSIPIKSIKRHSKLRMKACACKTACSRNVSQKNAPSGWRRNRRSGR